MNPIPLAEGWHHAVAASEWHRHWSQAEYPGWLVPNQLSSESDSTPPLIGSASFHREDWSSGGHWEWTGCKGTSDPPVRKAFQGPTHKGGCGKLAPILSQQRRGRFRWILHGDCRCCRTRWQNEKCLAPMCLDMLIFKSTDPNADVMYTLWRFSMQGWLDQYQEESMMPHIYTSLQGYPGRWVHSLEDGRNPTVPKLLVHMDHAFGDVHDYDTMIRSLYKIRQKDSESMEEYVTNP